MDRSSISFDRTMISTDYKELLLSNTKLISSVVPIPSSVTAVLKSNMFDVPNQKGFCEVTYFFLNILEPVKCKELLPWPCLNKKDEMKFRVGICKIITDISESSCGMVQPVTPSLILSPGGPQIIIFMVRLSMYVVKFVFEKQLDISLPDYVNPSSIPPKILKKRLELTQLKVHSRMNQFKRKLLNHKKDVIQSSKESSTMVAELSRIEKEKQEETIKLKRLIKEFDIEENLKNKLENDEAALDKYLQERLDKINSEVDDLKSDVEVITNFEKSVSLQYDLSQDMDEQKREKLVAGTLNVLVPSSLNSQVVLYKNNRLILENLFKVGLESTGIIHQKLCSPDLIDFFRHLSSVRPTISALSRDLSLCCSNMNLPFFELHQLYSNFRQSKDTFVDESVHVSIDMDSPLSKCLVVAQTPPINLNNSNENRIESEILQKIGGGDTLFQLIIKKNNAKNQTDNQLKNKKIKNKEIPSKFASRLKQPEKISIFSSTNKDNVRDKSTNTPKLNKTNSTLKKRCGVSTRLFDENSPINSVLTLKTQNDELPLKSLKTPITNVNKFVPNQLNTPQRRLTMLVVHSDKKCNSSRNLNRSLSSLISPMPTTSAAASFCSPRPSKTDEFLFTELDPSDLSNLSNETVVPDSDLENESLIATSSPVANGNERELTDSGFPSEASPPVTSEQGMVDPGSPSGILSVNRSRRIRPSIDAILARLEAIKLKQKKENPI